MELRHLCELTLSLLATVNPAAFSTVYRKEEKPYNYASFVTLHRLLTQRGPGAGFQTSHPAPVSRGTLGGAVSSGWRRVHNTGPSRTEN